MMICVNMNFMFNYVMVMVKQPVKKSTSSFQR